MGCWRCSTHRTLWWWGMGSVVQGGEVVCCGWCSAARGGARRGTLASCPPLPCPLAMADEGPRSIYVMRPGNLNVQKRHGELNNIQLALPLASPQHPRTPHHVSTSNYSGVSQETGTTREQGHVQLVTASQAERPLQMTAFPAISRAERGRCPSSCITCDCSLKTVRSQVTAGLSFRALLSARTPEIGSAAIDGGQSCLQAPRRTER